MKTKLFLLFFLTAAFGSVFLLFAPKDLQGEEIRVDVPPGMTFYQVAEQLERKGLVRKAFFFKVLVKIFPPRPLSVGEYRLSPRQSLWSQFQKIRRGDIVRERVTFPEGLNYYETAFVLKKRGWPGADEFLKLCRDPAFIKSLLGGGKGKPLLSLEGYLFPETYTLSKYTPPRALIEEMVRQFLKVYTEEKKDIPLSRHETAVLASLIEKETGAPEERPLIASVFYNRLKKGMKLQTDPTILYGLFLKEGFDRKLNIRKEDILSPSPYNTYVIQGLPPGPIAGFGRAALQAVFSPVKSDYLYFVSKNDGSHLFSKTYKEHNRAVYKYQILPFKKQKNK